MNCNNTELIELQDEIVNCAKCPRLRQHCNEIARVKRRAYLDWDYWGKPVPSFGDPNAEVLILGLAPGAHGANRTGRMFTGDKSGDFLYRAMYRAGFANQETSKDRADGLQLVNAWITAAGHCAPPDNRPANEELLNCRPYVLRELELLSRVKVVVVLGKIAFDTYLAARKSAGWKPVPAYFAHAAEYDFSPKLLCSYHPSQQNTSTGRLTQAMLDQIFRRATEMIRA